VTPCGGWCGKITSVSEDHSASHKGWRWRQPVPQISWWETTLPYGVTTHKTTTLIGIKFHILYSNNMTRYPPVVKAAAEVMWRRVVWKYH